MKKIEINSLTLIADNNDNIIGGYGFCDDDSAKPVIDKLIAEVVEKATAPKSPTCSCGGNHHCHNDKSFPYGAEMTSDEFLEWYKTYGKEEEECPCESCIESDCAGCEWETCPECGGELRTIGIGRRHTLVQCADCDWETTR